MRQGLIIFSIVAFSFLAITSLVLGAAKPLEPNKDLALKQAPDGAYQLSWAEAPGVIAYAVRASEKSIPDDGFKKTAGAFLLHGVPGSLPNGGQQVMALKAQDFKPGIKYFIRLAFDPHRYTRQGIPGFLHVGCIFPAFPACSHGLDSPDGSRLWIM